jgi:ABC-2 type transport system permease protein
VYAVGGEVALSVLPLEGAGRWSVGNNAYGWLAEGHRYFDPTTSCAAGERCSPLHVMTHLEAGTFLGILLLISVVVSLVWFNRRDV